MTEIDLKSTKIELAEFILRTKNASLIQRIKEFVLAEDTDFWLELTKVQKEEIKLGRQQIKDGNTESWDSLKLRLNAS